MFYRLALGITCVLGFAVTPVASAQQYQINWHTIDGGGGTSIGGVYSLQGTIGQPDADVVSLCSSDGSPSGSCTGATYELTGGFWAGIASAPGVGSPTCGAVLNCIFRHGFET